MSALWGYLSIACGGMWVPMLCFMALMLALTVHAKIEIKREAQAREKKDNG